MDFIGSSRCSRRAAHSIISISLSETSDTGRSWKKVNRTPSERQSSRLLISALAGPTAVAGRVEQTEPLEIASTPNSRYLSRLTKIIGGGG
jgi:hypothetical protein